MARGCLHRRSPPIRPRSASSLSARCSATRVWWRQIGAARRLTIRCVALRVTDAGGTELYRTPSTVDANLASTTRFQPEWGELVDYRVALRTGSGPRASRRRPSLADTNAHRPDSDRGHARERRRAVIWRMHDLSRLRADFTSSVSHELRTPLTQILLYAETIEMGRQRSPEKRAQAISVITRETRRLIHLVENVLQFSRAERSLTQLRLRPHELGAIVAETVGDFQPVAESRGMTVALRLDGPVHARVDADAIRRVLLNLLDNAVRYGPAGQTIVVTAAQLGDRARIVVEDEGPGIPRDRREAIWQPFVRLDDVTASPATGCGIGLAIVSELIALHGGRRGVGPRAGRGASFFVELPAA